MDNASSHVSDLIFGRWRSQILYAGVELGIFDHVDRETAKQPETLAREIDADPSLLYQLLRALASLGLLQETHDRGFRLTGPGALLRSDHPQSMRAMTRLEEGPQHYALWKHLPAMVRDGQQNGFTREFGRMAFEHAKSDPDYAERFKHAMSSFSAFQAGLVLSALQEVDFSSERSLCDVGGGYGYMMAALLRAYPHLSGIVLDLAEVVGDRHELMAAKFGVEHRCRYVAGDMFRQIPAADDYLLKLILHDWNDATCVEILSNARRSARAGARIFIVEHVLPGCDEPHFGKLFDIHMMCWGGGRERTQAEYAGLLERAGWKLSQTHYPPGRLIGVIEGRAVAPGHDAR